MKNKEIQFYNKLQIVQNTDVKYSSLLEQFIEPFANSFSNIEYYEEIFEFAINAWNFGNMKLIFPKGESNIAINALNYKDINLKLLHKMIDYKVNRFAVYSNFIIDYELKEKNGETVLSVITQEQNAYLATMLENITSEDSEAAYEENFIDRSAIIIKPQQPFLNWYLNLYPEDKEELDELKETRTYLINEDIENIEAWLKKRFNKIFELELGTWHFNKKEWPQKRNYKMFKEWFKIDISTMIYDLEKNPVSKL